MLPSSASQLFTLYSALLIALLISGAMSLRLTKFYVPSPVYQGESIICECEYDEGEDHLAALFWSLNGTRFFKYEPDGGPSSQFSIMQDNELRPLFEDGILQVSRKSNGTRLVLENVSPELSGELACGLVLVKEGPGELILYEKRWIDVRIGKREPWAMAGGVFGKAHSNSYSNLLISITLLLLSIFLIK